ncbi:MAG: hypothetical protein M3512_12640 [Bacteroidota bacterium]|nr:hypothetical protein [Bacteroidota bacterium]
MHLFKKTLKVIAYFIIGIVLLLFVASFFLDPIAKNFLESKINDFDAGQYAAEIENVNISLLRGNFIVNGIQVRTDSASARENNTPVIKLDAGEISVEGVSWLDFLLSNNLQLDRASFLDLNIEAKVRNIDTSDNTGPFEWEDLDIYPLINDHVDKLKLNDLRFRNFDLTLLNIESHDTLVFGADEFNVLSDDILINANKVFTDARAFYASKIDILGKDVTIKRSGNTQWQTALEVIELKTRESDFGLLSENVLFYKEGKTKNDTLLFASYEVFNLFDLDLNRVQEDSVAHIKSLSLQSLRVINNFDIDKEDAKEADNKNTGFDITKFSLGDNLPDLLDRIRIDEVLLKDINYQEQNHLTVQKISFASQNLIFDKKPAFSDNRFFHAKAFNVSIESLKYLERKRMLEIALDSFDIQIKNGTGNLSIDHLAARNTKRVAGELYAEAALEGFKIMGIDTRELTDKKFNIDSIAMEYPKLLVELGSGTGEENVDESLKLDLYPLIEGILNEVQINKIAVIGADIKLSGMEGNQNTLNLPAVYLQLSDVLIAEGTAFEGGRVMHADDIAVRMERILFPLPDNVHKINLDLLRMSTREKFLHAYGLTYDYNQNYMKILKGPESNQIMNISNNSFLVDNLEYEHLIKQKGLFASSVSSEGLNVKIYKDNNYPAEESTLSYNTPQQMIKDIGLPFYIGNISIGNTDIVYEELSEGAEKPGKISLNNLNLKVDDFSNVNKIILNKPETAIYVNGLLLGDGYFETDMLIPMQDENQPVKISGKVDTFDLKKLNRYTEFTTRFGVESGTIYKILWEFEAGKSQAVGSFGLSYDNLNVQLSESKSSDPAGTLFQIGAFLANELVINEEIAAKKSEEPEIAEFEREKDEEESFVDHYVSSLMAGFLEVMGFPLSLINP